VKNIPVMIYKGWYCTIKKILLIDQSPKINRLIFVWSENCRIWLFVIFCKL